MPTRKLEVQIVGDSRSLERAFTRSGVAAQGFGATVDRAAVGTRNLGNLFAGGLAAAGAVSVLKTLTTSASDMNEEVSKSRVIFGSSAKTIESWSKTTAKSFGISRTEALRAAGTFGALFSGAGRQSASEAAKLSKVVVNLAGDLASFNNTSTDDALNALRSGLSGEIEPLRRFQVFLTEAAVAQRAMTDTGKTSATQLTQGERILARYALILEQTKKAQGDAARTSGEFAGQQRILKAQSADLAAKVGTVLIPAATKLATELNTAAGLAIDLTGALGKLATVTIPPIHIPLVVDIQGGSILDAAGAFHGTFGPGGPEKIARFIGGKAKETASAVADAINKAFPDSLIKLPTSKTGDADHKREAALKKFIAGRTFGSPLNTLPDLSRTASRPGLAATQRNTFFDSALTRALDRAQDGSLQAQLAKLAKVSATLTARIAVTKDITRKLNLEDQLVAVGRQRRSIEDQISGELKSRLADAKAAKIEEQAKALQLARERQAKAVEAAAKALQRLQSRQFKALGLSSEGGDIVPGVSNLQKQLASLTERLGGSSVKLSSKLQSQLAGARKVLSGDVFGLGKATVESRQKIVDLFATIRGEFNKGTSSLQKGPLTRGSGLDTKKFLEGITGLTAAQESEIRGRLSGVNSAGLTLSPSGTRSSGGGFVGGRPIIVESHTTVQLDGHTVGKSVTRSQQKTKKRNPPQRRGPNRAWV